MLKKTSIIGTGLSGLVGSRVVKLLNNKYSFTNFDLTTGVDITNPQSVKKAIEQASGEVLLHFAAFTNVDEAHKQKGDKNGLCYKINVLGSRYVAQYSAEFTKYLIHISTDFVFDGEQKSPYKETDLPNPIDWYGQTKLLAEKEVTNVGGKYSIVRIAFPFRSSFPHKSDIVRTIIDKLRNSSLYPMFADQIITPTFIDDIAVALEIFIKKRPVGTYHLVGSSSISPYQLARKIATKFGFDAKQIKKGSLAEFLKSAQRPYQKRLAISNGKAKRRLGISMSTINQALDIVKKQIVV